MSSSLFGPDAPPPQRGVLLTGQVVDGRYRLGTRLGGEAADPRVELYSAVQLSLDRPVLVKVLRLGLGASAAANLTTRLRHEALLLARLDHPNLVRVVDYGVHEGSPYIVRELVEGLSLRRMFTEGRAFTPEQAAPILVQIAAALEHAHEAGVVHRDLSPTKIIVSRDGRVRITDLGLAKLIARGAEEEERAGGRLASVVSLGSAIEHPEYAAPEVLLGGAVDRRADLYSLGAIAYRMVAKRTPFTGEGAAGVLAARIHAHLVPLAEAAQLGRESHRFAAVVDRLLAVDREQRCSTAAWVGHALRVSVLTFAGPDGDGSATELALGAVAEQTAARPEVAAPAVEVSAVVPAPAVVAVAPAAGVVAPAPAVVAVPSSRPGPMSVQEARAARDPEVELAAAREAELPDGTAAAVLVADPYATEHARAVEQGRDHSGCADTALRLDVAAERLDDRRADERLADDDPAVLATKSSFVLAVERAWRQARPRAVALIEGTRPHVAALIERARPHAERLIERAGPQAAALWSRASHGVAARLGAPSRSRGVQASALGLIAVLVVLALVSAGRDDPPTRPVAVRAGEPTVVELAARARALTKAGDPAQAIEQLEQALVTGGRYGDPALHAALAAAYVRSGQGGRALQHFGLVIGRDPSVIEDADVASLVGLLGLPKRDGEKVAELLGTLGPRAVPALRVVSEDKSVDKGLRKKASALLRSIESRAASGRTSAARAEASAATARR